MRTRHTPGPWKTKASSKDTRDHFTVAASDGSICNAGNSRRPRGEIEANVRLIASAPDLLVVLTATLPHLPGDSDLFHTAVHVIRDATGRIDSETRRETITLGEWN